MFVKYIITVSFCCYRTLVMRWTKYQMTRR